jgi:hypothetical protein
MTAELHHAATGQAAASTYRAKGNDGDAVQPHGHDGGHPSVSDTEHRDAEHVALAKVGDNWLGPAEG